MSMHRGSLQKVDGRDVEVLVTPQEIAARVDEIARQVEADCGDCELVVIGVLKGSFIFMADLVRAIDKPMACDFLRVSSYAHDRSTGAVRLDFDITQPVAGKYVLLVEDVIDTGQTLRYLRHHMMHHRPAVLKVASLLLKPKGASQRGDVDYVGFELPDRYLIGYGLDSNGLHRNLPYIGAFI